MSAHDPKRTLFSLIRSRTIISEKTRKKTPLIELLLGGSVIGSVGSWRHLTRSSRATRLLAGGLQGENEECSPRYWAPLLILEIVEPSHELGAPIWLSVHHPEAGARHRGDDVASVNFQLNAGIGHGFPLLRS